MGCFSDQGYFEKQVARLLKRPATKALQPVQEVARLHEVAEKCDVLVSFQEGLTNSTVVLITRRYTERDLFHADVFYSHAEAQRTQSVAQSDIFIAAAWSLGSFLRLDTLCTP